MTLATSSTDALVEFDARRAALAREISELTRSREAAQERLDAIEIEAVLSGRTSDREAERLQKKIRDIDQQLPAKQRALAATDQSRLTIARPIMDQQFSGLAAERDQLAAEHRAILEEEADLLARLEVLDERVAELEHQDKVAARAQERAVAVGALAVRPGSVLVDGVLAASVPGLRAQTTVALSRHSAIRRSI